MKHAAYFDVTGQQLGEAFQLTASAPVTTAPIGSSWSDAFGKVVAGAVDFFKTREQRKLEEQYVKAGMKPAETLINSPMLMPAGYTPQQAAVANVSESASKLVVPVMLIGTVALFLMARK